MLWPSLRRKRAKSLADPGKGKGVGVSGTNEHTKPRNLPLSKLYRDASNPRTPHKAYVKVRNPPGVCVRSFASRFHAPFLLFLAPLFQRGGLVWTAGLFFFQHPCRVVSSFLLFIWRFRKRRAKRMQERIGKLSITFGRLSRSRDNSSPSVISPKSPESSPRLQTSPADNTSHVTSRSTGPSLPASTPNRSQGVQRVMTEPPRPLPAAAAVAARPRSISYSTHPSALVRSSLSTRTPTQPSNPSNMPRRHVGRLLMSMRLKTPSNRKPSKAGNRKNHGLILALLVFCLTAIVCIYSLPVQKVNL